MGSEIRKPKHLISQQNVWISDGLVFKQLGLQLQPLLKPDHLKSDFQKVWISIVSGFQNPLQTDHKRLENRTFLYSFRVSFEYQTIWHPDYFGPFEYRARLVFGSPLQFALRWVVYLQKSNGPRTTGCGRSTSLRSPRVASSRVQLCKVSEVWLTIKTSRTMSYCGTQFEKCDSHI